MTDDLRDVFDPLLSDPPHPAPPLDQLRARVDRRRQRRARTIGACSIMAVVLVAAAVLALPRDTELRVGGEAPTTQPPPPPTRAPVQLVVTPESAPATTERNIEIRNTSTNDYTTCGTYDLFRWDGGSWSPVIQVFLGGGGTMLGRYDPSSTATECSWSPISVAAGDTTSLGFEPNTGVWWMVTATALPGTSPLAEGWYELRDPAGVPTGVDPGAVGRFEITPPGEGETRYSPPPPVETPIQLTVDPEQAFVSVSKTVAIRNGSDQPYFECGWTFQLRRWDGRQWVPVGLVSLTGDQLTIREGDPNVELQCVALDPIAPGETRTFPFQLHWARLVDDAGGTVPPRRLNLPAGTYEFQRHRGAGSDLAVGGRFEIIDVGSPGGPTGPATGPNGKPADPASEPVTVE